MHSSKALDAELQAIRDICSILEQLPPDAQGRVIFWFDQAIPLPQRPRNGRSATAQQREQRELQDEGPEPKPVAGRVSPQHSVVAAPTAATAHQATTALTDNPTPVAPPPRRPVDHPAVADAKELAASLSRYLRSKGPADSTEVIICAGRWVCDTFNVLTFTAHDLARHTAAVGYNERAVRTGAEEAVQRGLFERSSSGCWMLTPLGHALVNELSGVRRQRA